MVMTRRKKTCNLTAIILTCAIVLVLLQPVRSFCITHKNMENLVFEVPNGQSYTIRTIHYSYPNNRYVSLKDMSYALRGTDKHFDVNVQRAGTEITTGKDSLLSRNGNIPFAADEYVTDAIRLNPLAVDERECRYYTLMGLDDNGDPDLFMSITDLAMILNANLDIDIDRGILKLDPGDFYIDMTKYEEQGLYYEVSSALVADAVTGTVYSAYNADLSVSAASTTKLMTYLCIMDAISAGEISLDDTVTITAEAEALSHTSDGVIQMNRGQTAKLEDMLYAVLLPSSNEASLALAQHLDGSEEAFVQRMNNKAKELGLSDATFFYNCHGLPCYSNTVAASKIQNHISAYDMFMLSSHILNKYPEIMTITSTKKYRLDAFGTEVENSNPLLYNLPGVVGLKTGTTKSSGASLISAYETDDDTGHHIIVAVEYGAEDATVRNTVSEIMIRYGIQCIKENDKGNGFADDGAFPDTAGKLLRQIVLIKSRERNT